MDSSSLIKFLGIAILVPFSAWICVARKLTKRIMLVSLIATVGLALYLTFVVLRVKTYQFHFALICSVGLLVFYLLIRLSGMLPRKLYDAVSKEKNN